MRGPLPTGILLFAGLGLAAGPLPAPSLPRGVAGAVLGMTEAELLRLGIAQPAAGEGSSGSRAAFELSPSARPLEIRRAFLYFNAGRLYHIVLVYGDEYATTVGPDGLVRSLTAQYGPPAKEADRFWVWEDSRTQIRVTAVNALIQSYIDRALEPRPGVRTL